MKLNHQSEKFSKSFKNVPVLSIHVLAALQFNSSYFGLLLRKIIKPPDLNDTKPPIRKSLKNVPVLSKAFQSKSWSTSIIRTLRYSQAISIIV